VKRKCVGAKWLLPAAVCAVAWGLAQDAWAFGGTENLATVGVLVLEEATREPVANVKVVGTLAGRTNPGGRWETLPKVHGTTDAQGRCTISGVSASGVVTVEISRVPLGYYRTSVEAARTFTTKRWKAWNPGNLVVTLAVQRVERPVPLHVRQVGRGDPRHAAKDVFPKENMLSYDLVKGDWLPPAGVGEQADVVFTRRFKESLMPITLPNGDKGEAYRDVLKVSFPGDGNGVVEHVAPAGAGLKIRTAPADGYVHDWESWDGVDLMAKRDTSYNANRCFSFRIRTKRDAQGKIESAHYGKIYGDLFFSMQMCPEKVAIAVPRFACYLNPTPLDRNLEWNLVNLCRTPGEYYRLEP